MSNSEDNKPKEKHSFPRNRKRRDLFVESDGADFVLTAGDTLEKTSSFRKRGEKVRVDAGQKVDAGRKDEAGGIKNLDLLPDLLAILKVQTGHDFSGYKHSTLIRCISRHLQIHGIDDLKDYLKILSKRSDQILSLLKNLRISVTNFFRDKKVFAELEKSIVPALFEGKTAGDQVRIWTAGCASGEEAYSIAILLCEYAATLPSPPKIQIFASDVDENAVAEARRGCFDESIAADVSPERLEKFFIRKENGDYCIRKRIREMIVFTPHNILRDPPFSQIDLVSCRNVLIFLNQEMQEKVLRIFHFALRAESFLLLGASESAKTLPDNFSTLDAERKIYRHRSVKSAWSAPPALPVRGVWMPSVNRLTAERFPNPPSFGELHERLTGEYAPASVLLNENDEVLHLSENAGRFLRFAGGSLTLNFLKVIHPALLLDVRAALFAAKRKNKTVKVKNICFELNGLPSCVNIIARPLNTPGAAAFIVFEEIADEESAAATPQTVSAAESNATETMRQQAETELNRVKEQLRLTIEQYEELLEESKIGSEELQATNEELRAAGEELETGKEELQSVNEELTTVNYELKEKIEEIRDAHSDLKNLMAATHIATIFLDRELKIKRYTPATTELFNLIPADVGRPLAHITHHLAPDNFHEDAARILANLQTSEREVYSKGVDKRFFIARFAPYRTVEDKIDGVVLNFIDITERRRTEEALRETSERFSNLLNSMDEAFVIKELIEDENGDPEDFRYLQFNPAFIRQMGVADPTGKTVTQLIPGIEPEWLETYVEVIRTGKPVRFQRRIGNLNRWLDVFASRVGAAEEKKIALLFTDITERKLAEEALRESEERIRIAVEAAELATWEWDLIADKVYWNERHFLLFGLKPKRRSVTPEDFFKYVHPDEQKRVGDLLQTAIAEKGIFRAEFRAVTEQGEMRWMSGYGRITGEFENQPVRMSGVMYEITERREAEEELQIYRSELEKRVDERTLELAATNRQLEIENGERQKAEQERMNLLRKLVTTQEDERRRIARDLHDHLGQQLTSLRLKLEIIKELCGGDPSLCKQANKALAISGKIDADIDFLAWELRPSVLDDLGFAAALTKYAAEWSRQFKIAADLRLDRFRKKRLAVETENNLYRIAQEALNNIAKHAEASRIDISLEKRGEFAVLIIEDNGIGFDPGKLSAAEKSDKPIGLIGMRERAALVGGNLEIESASGQGTTLFVRVPLTETEKENE